MRGRHVCQVCPELPARPDVARRQLELLRLQGHGGQRQELERHRPLRVPVRGPLLRAADDRVSGKANAGGSPREISVPVHFR